MAMATQAISWPLLLIMSLYGYSLIPKATSEPTFVYNTCENSTSFTPNSKYHTNLKTLLQSLSSNATAPAASLFYSTAVGAGTADAVYGLFLCRGDQNATTCNDCVTMATKTDLPTIYCTDKRAAVIYYDQCMVRYSNRSVLGTIDRSTEDRILMNDFNTKGNSTLLNVLLIGIMNDLTAQASEGDKSGKKFAAKQTNFTKTEDLYAMAQCTPDLSSDDCGQCLKDLIPKLLVKKQGAQVLRPNCIVRYENYPFYIGAVALPVTANSSAGGSGLKVDCIMCITEHVSSKCPLDSKVAIGCGIGLSVFVIVIIASCDMSKPLQERKVSGKTIAAIVVPVAVVSLAVLVMGTCLITRKAKKYDPVALEHVGEDFTNVESLQYDLSTLQSATNNFSDENKLGEGGFGGVYKGSLPEGQVIAVKRLSRSSGQGIQEFKNEVLVVAKLQHRNLVRLLGFCVAGEEKLLVYEYVPNKSLDYFLFDPRKQGQLNWSKRYKIMAGIARGMVYLHQDSRLRIIHRDLKTSNILLDADMNP